MIVYIPERRGPYIPERRRLQVTRGAGWGGTGGKGWNCQEVEGLGGCCKGSELSFCC